MAEQIPAKFQPVHAVQAHKAELSSVKFNKKGDLLASSSWKKKIHIWTIEDDRFNLKTKMKGHKAGVSDIAFSSDDLQLASASDDKTVKLWDVATASCIRTFKGHSDYVFSLCFQRNMIFSGSDDKTAKVWDTREGLCIKDIQFHSDRVTSVDFSKRYNRILTSSLDYIFAFHEFRMPKVLDYQVAPDCVSHARFTGEGRNVAVSTFDSVIRLWDYIRKRTVRKYEGHQNSKYSVFSHSSHAATFLASGSEDRNIYIWYPKTEEIAQVLEDQKDSVLAVQFHPKNERILVSGCLDNTMTLYKNEITD